MNSVADLQHRDFHGTSWLVLKKIVSKQPPPNQLHTKFRLVGVTTYYYLWDAMCRFFNGCSSFWNVNAICVHLTISYPEHFLWIFPWYVCGDQFPFLQSSAPRRSVAHALSVPLQPGTADPARIMTITEQTILWIGYRIGDVLFLFNGAWDISTASHELQFGGIYSICFMDWIVVPELV